MKEWDVFPTGDIADLKKALNLFEKEGWKVEKIFERGWIVITKEKNPKPVVENLSPAQIAQSERMKKYWAEKKAKGV